MTHYAETHPCEIRTLARPTPHHGTIVCIYHRGAFQVWDAACECGWRDEDLTTWAYAYWALHRHQTEETA